MKLPPPGARVPASTHAGDTSFDAVVFAGGGCRCFWQAGFWSVATPAIGIAPSVVVGVSAGAAFAAASLLGVADRVLEDFKRRTAANSRNVYPRNVLRGSPAFPHESMYRGAILASLEGVELARLHTGPDLRILLARSPRWAGDRTGFWMSGLAYVLDRYELRVHPRWGARFGFTPEVVSARTCADSEELAALILQSSCTPPLLPRYRRDGRLVLDGGLIDNAPADSAGESRSTLVLLTRAYPAAAMPAVRGRTYVAPSRPVPIVKWDYTRPDLVQATYDLGRRDGEAFVRAWPEARDRAEDAAAPEPSRLAG